MTDTPTPRCALCGSALPDEPKLTLGVVVLGDGKPRPLAQTRRICVRCSDPQEKAELQSTLRRLPTLLPDAF